ncbi:ABC transporter permease subunit [Mesorhizobium sp.]|uniref:ABC transporter permease subunit n=1 Tax=Mesorhizobium sp. TaxID=1871066 RepID=UPI000FE90850|nr:ABC transporter permease subunit [Mesorhizobium sp.]RWI08694.1 MAG: ABC transporter permease subunit [Mesorhizobium sp.]RWM85675.1 MAG: ABC transporter permease subunit [Mesorhizobium sp.]
MYNATSARDNAGSAWRKSTATNLLTVAAVAACLTYFSYNIYSELGAKGINIGFGFLTQPTRWDVSVSFVSQNSGDPYWYTFVVGFINTLALAAVVVVSSTILGVVMGLVRSIGSRPLKIYASIFTSVFRNLPLPLLIFFFYAAFIRLPAPRSAHELGGVFFLSNRGLTMPTLVLPYESAVLLVLLAATLVLASFRLLFPRQRNAVRLFCCGAIALVLIANLLLGNYSVPVLEGLRFRGGTTFPAEFATLVVAITCFGGAYIGEVIRGGIEAVPPGQIEAARSLGLRSQPIFWLVVMPQALPSIVPPLGNQYLFLVRATTLGVAVGYAEFFMITSTTINQTGQSIEVLFLLMATFLVLNLTMTGAINYLNRVVSFR